MFCREQMVDLQKQLNRFEKAQIKPVAVVMATPDQALELVEKHHLTFPVLCDPEQKAYQAFGISKGRPWQYLGPRIWLAGLRALLRGGIGKPSYDVTQMHGTVVVDTTGSVLFKHVGQHSADYTPIEKVLSVAK